MQLQVILVVDAMEVTGGGAGGKKSRKNLTLDELEALQVRYETRKLSIGDFVWIAKSSLRPGKSAVYIWPPSSNISSERYEMFARQRPCPSLCCGEEENGRSEELDNGRSLQGTENEASQLWGAKEVLLDRGDSVYQR